MAAAHLPQPLEVRARPPGASGWAASLQPAPAWGGRHVQPGCARLSSSPRPSGHDARPSRGSQACRSQVWFCLGRLPEAITPQSQLLVHLGGSAGFMFGKTL